MEKEKSFDQLAYQNEFIKNNYDVVRAAVPKGEKARWAEHAKAHGDKSLTAFIQRAIRETIERDMQEVTQ